MTRFNVLCDVETTSVTKSNSQKRIKSPTSAYPVNGGADFVTPKIPGLQFEPNKVGQ